MISSFDPSLPNSIFSSDPTDDDIFVTTSKRYCDRYSAMKKKNSTFSLKNFVVNTSLLLRVRILWWMHSRTGQWSQPDSPDGLALMGALPVQHRLWQRPGVLHRRESVQTGVILSSVHLSYLVLVRWQICWSLEATGMWGTTPSSSTTAGLIIRGVHNTVQARRNICFVHCQLILINSDLQRANFNQIPKGFRVESPL